MLELVSKFFGGAIITITGVLIISRILNKKINILNFKTILILLILSSTSLILYNINYNYNNSLIIFVLATYGYSRLFKISIDQAIVATFLIFILLSIAEVLFIILNFLVFKIDIGVLRNTTTFIPYFANIIVCVIALFFLSIKPLQRLMKEAVKLVSAPQKTIVVIFCLTEIISICLLLFKLSSNFDSGYSLSINLILIFLFLFIFLVFITERIRYEKLIIEYENLVNYVKNIEDWMEKDLIRNHENKNHLIVIKNMVPKNNKKLIQYINSIMSELIEVEDAWLVKLKNIPRGGLQGLIYYKISQIKKESINLSLDISQNLKKTYFSKLDTENNRDLCTILGVYLDNAIDAAKQSDKKQIGIEIYPYQDVIRIAISNTYRGTLDINKFYNYGYTTKGVGRGYGLALVKSIVEKNKHFNEHREVINDYYIQYLDFKKI
ncbi:MAG: sensor histidine kinase [Bacilli bacterium]|jgi:two-component system sensor histidine kinase AgrC